MEAGYILGAVVLVLVGLWILKHAVGLFFAGIKWVVGAAAFLFGALVALAVLTSLCA